MNVFKPQLLPNNKAGEIPNWEERIERPEEWLLSNKYDGARVEIMSDGEIKGRSLKSLSSLHVNQMARDIAIILQSMKEVIIEAEFYSHEMTFPEIIHFFKTEDVTSDHTISKYRKLWDKTKGGTIEILKGIVYPSGTFNNDVKNVIKWKYPGRDVQWLTTWHDSLKFYAFDHVNLDFLQAKAIRTEALKIKCDKYTKAMGDLSHDLVFIEQYVVKNIDAMHQMYDEAIINGYEGVVAMHKGSHYKFGRYTLNSKQGFKIKNDNQEFDGLIIGVEESTVAINGAPKSINELGRSVTSKLKEHRQPSGMAKGFLVRMEDGRELTVSLKGFDHKARKELMYMPTDWVGRSIKFTGMDPVKVGGVPRHAHYTNGNIKDTK